MTTPSPSAGPRPQSIEHWASTRPNRPALHERGRSYTWAEWNELSDRLAQALVERGIRPGDVVGNAMNIRTEWALLWGALSKLGCRSLGLNWRLTPAETAFVLSNSGAVAYITDATSPSLMLPALEPLNLRLQVSIDAPATGYVSWSDLLSTPAVPRFSLQDAPGLVYTSGTTGRPKGVVSRQPKTETERQRWLAYMQSVMQRIPRGDDDVSLVTLPFSHGAGPALVRSSVMAGNAMVLQRRFDAEDVLRLIEQYRISIWIAVPTMLKRLAALPADVIARHDLSSLKAIETGAAPVPGALKQWVRDTWGASVLHETYGATELGMVTHLPPEMQPVKPASSGRPLTNVDIQVRDAEGRCLPAGHSGELWVRTPMTIESYLNEAPLDSTTLDAEGFFRIGDVGHVDEDGYLYITDRTKDMIISGGVNIYPTEVEAALYAHPAVQDVAVIGIPDPEFGEQVQAFIEVKPDHRVSSEELSQFLEDRLASYKRPKGITFIQQLPRNPVGKVLKRELREPFWAHTERSV